MTWVRIDDQFPDHPKIAAAGPLAGWLHVCGLCYCNRNLTDGFIPESVAYRLTSFEHVGLETGDIEGMATFASDVDCESMAKVLCEHGIWKKVAGGFAIHDYLDFQLSKAEILDIRSKRQAAGQAGGLASAKAKRQAKAKQNSTIAQPQPPTQDHAPKSTSSVSELPPSSVAKEPARADDDIPFDADVAETQRQAARWNNGDMQTIGQYAEEGGK